MMEELKDLNDEDMKLAKFRCTCEEIRDYLTEKINIYLIPKGKYDHNIYLKCVNDVCCWKDKRNPTYLTWYNDGKKPDLDNLYQVLKESKKRKEDTLFMRVLYSTVFWNLFALAVDDEAYNNEMSKVIDLAYCFGFNESMLKDWCLAVAYMMNENSPVDEFHLNIETRQGKEFFFYAYNNQIEEGHRSFLLGKTAARTIKTDTGLIIVEGNHKITEMVLQKAMLANKLIELSMNSI